MGVLPPGASRTRDQRCPRAEECARAGAFNLGRPEGSREGADEAGGAAQDIAIEPRSGARVGGSSPEPGREKLKVCRLARTPPEA